MTPASDWTKHILGMMSALDGPKGTERSGIMLQLFCDELEHMITRIQSDALNSNAESHAASIRCCNHIALLDEAQIQFLDVLDRCDIVRPQRTSLEIWFKRWRKAKESACKFSVSIPKDDYSRPDNDGAL